MLGVTFALQLDDQTLHYLAAGTGVVLIGVITWLNNSRNQNEDEQNVVGNINGVGSHKRITSRDARTTRKTYR